MMVDLHRTNVRGGAPAVASIRHSEISKFTRLQSDLTLFRALTTDGAFAVDCRLTGRSEMQSATGSVAEVSGGSVTVKILLIEDSCDDAFLIQEHLRNAAPGKHRVPRLADGLSALQQERWDAVLLDLGLPDAQGLDTLRLLRTAGRDLPIIVLSGVDDESLALGAVEDGAHDFLDKNHLSGVSLIRSLKYAQERNRLMLKLREQALHDSLTGLPNRACFDEQVERAVARSGYSDEPFIVMFFDLDGFKVVNDVGGHEVGDRLLRQVANRLRGAVRKNDVLARSGDDEFAAIVFGVCARKVAEQVADRFHQAFAEPFTIGNQRFSISSSIGIAANSDVGNSAPAVVRGELLRDADMAMYVAKSQGPGRTQFYDHLLRTSLIEKASLEQRLHEALANDELHLHFQPIIHLETRETLGLKALCRWSPEGREPVSPAVFVPIAEQTGLIQPIGRWVLRQACADYALWKRTVAQPPLGIHVNVSRLQLSDSRLLPTIQEALNDNGLDPGELTIEITESCVIDEDLAMRVFAELVELGVGLAIDDFGVGYSALGHLRRFPFNRLKIDRSFIAQLDDGEGEPGVLLEAITTLATSLGLETIAEGVETESQAQRLRETGCTLAQGFLFARPTPIESLCAVPEAVLC
jgi:diguanylate cyclase (GGDEF)-like protein